MSHPRPPITAHEKSVILTISAEISKSETFFCQGKITDVGVSKPTLFYLPSGDATDAKYVLRFSIP